MKTGKKRNIEKKIYSIKRSIKMKDVVTKESEGYERNL